MMNNTKEIKAFYESIILDRMADVMSRIKTEGFTDDTYTSLRMLERDLNALNNAEHFFNAWNAEGHNYKKRGA